MGKTKLPKVPAFEEGDKTLYIPEAGNYILYGTVTEKITWTRRAGCTYRVMHHNGSVGEFRTDNDRGYIFRSPPEEDAIATLKSRKRRMPAFEVGDRTMAIVGKNNALVYGAVVEIQTWKGARKGITYVVRHDSGATGKYPGNMIRAYLYKAPPDTPSAPEW